VEFSAPVALREDTVRFGLEFTNTLNAFAPAIEGSLKQISRNTYTVRFETAPILTVLPFAGRHEFWIGGRTEDDTSYAGRIVIDVE